MPALETQFAELFGAPPEFVVRAPGRVNLIGEHTDYNEGFVFPAALDFEVRMAGSRRPDRQVRAFALNEGVGSPSTTFSLDSLAKSSDAGWSNYMRSVAAALHRDGHVLCGMNVVVYGTVPIGSGLSSSAAMEMASSLAFESASGFQLDPVKRALLGQQAEWDPAFVGVKCGIMDQFISSLGRRAHALFIDTRTLGYEAVPLPESGVALLIANTNVKHELAGDDSAYNTRRAECEQAVELLRPALPEIQALRDVSVEQFETHKDMLPDVVRKRARHVVTEDARVLESVAALKAGDVARFGELMNASHNSLRDDYEVSCRELDVMVDAARAVDGVLGSRMTGAGFGGCTVSLVREEAVESFRSEVGAEYKRQTGIEPTFYVCRASDGASRIK
jgi:galactokinase